MQTGNHDINIVFTIDTVNVQLAEEYIHEYLNYEKEFFYVSSLDKAKEIATFITNLVNECIGKYDDDYEVLQKQYIADNSKATDKMDLVVPVVKQLIRGRSKSPVTHKTIAPNPVLQIENKCIYKQYLDKRTKTSDTHIHTSALYDDFKIWFASNKIGDNLPSNREFIKTFRKYHTILSNVKVNGKPTNGIKNLQLIA